MHYRRGRYPSRVAETLFWFGRYAERCDDSARLLRLALNQISTATTTRIV